MTIKEKINGILEKYGVKLSVEEPKEVKFVATGKTSDGIEVVSPDDAFAVGSEIFVVDADGNTSPAPDAVHRVTIVTDEGEKSFDITTEGGVIAAIVDVAEAEPVEEVIEAMAAQLSAMNAKVTEIETKLAAAEKRATDAEAQVAELSKKAASLSVTKAKGEKTKTTDVEVPKIVKGNAAQAIFKATMEAKNK